MSQGRAVFRWQAYMFSQALATEASDAKVPCDADDTPIDLGVRPIISQAFLEAGERDIAVQVVCVVLCTSQAINRWANPFEHGYDLVHRDPPIQILFKVIRTRVGFVSEKILEFREAVVANARTPVYHVPNNDATDPRGRPH